MPLVVLVVVAAVGTVIVGSNALIGNTLQNLKAKSDAEYILKQSASYLDEKKLEGAKIRDYLVGTVALPDGNFSAFKVVDAEVHDK